MASTHFQATVGSDSSTLVSDIGPKVRFFVFRGDADPETKALPGVSGEPPIALAGPVSKQNADALITRLFRHAFSREPNEREREVARRILGKPGELGWSRRSALDTRAVSGISIWSVRQVVL